MKMKNPGIRRAATIAGIMTLACGISPAYAEGSRTTYISYWSTGGESSRWHDGNTDSAQTAVRFNNCSVPSSPGTGASASVQVWKNVDFAPDTNLGGKQVCGTTQYWGDVSAGDYYFRLDKINGTYYGFHLDSDPVWINY
ncbi:hypothetical protein ABZ153_09800 [Streptomyces sp. NPDC006290]|uniref:hypothetical protein n=1 Tax=Streptomyces sp. NPDC006290 TaxID=3156745 RepID=UPI0033BCEF1A